MGITRIGARHTLSCLLYNAITVPQADRALGSVILSKGDVAQNGIHRDPSRNHLSPNNHLCKFLPLPRPGPDVLCWKQYKLVIVFCSSLLFGWRWIKSNQPRLSKLGINSFHHDSKLLINSIKSIHDSKQKKCCINPWLKWVLGNKIQIYSQL